jgi:very-short-patch-repair endonuclease
MTKPKYIISGQRIDPVKLKRAKTLRREMTPAERLLWSRLRRNQLGYHFRRQQIIDGFIVDFYCHSASLIVEVDGPIHEQQIDYDDNRDEVLAKRDMLILRVTNQEVIERLEETIERIREVCQIRS